MPQAQCSTVVGVFRERGAARGAIAMLKAAGFAPKAISILSPDGHATPALAITGIGPFIACGAFAAALGGSTLVTVAAAGRYAEAQRLLHENGADDIDCTTAAPGGRALPQRGRVYGEIGVRKGRTQQASERLLRQVAWIDRESSTALGGQAEFGHWDRVKAGFRARWQRRAGSTDQDWEDVEPSFRYGWDLRNDPRFRDRQSWNDVAADAQRDWATLHPEMPWARAEDNVREAWEGSTR